MRICYIATSSVHTTRWIKYFAEAGHDVHVITTDKSFGIDIENVKVHLLKRFGPDTRFLNHLINSIPLIVQFNRLLKKLKPDIIHAHQIMDITLLCSVSGFHPYVATPWGSDVLISPQKSRISRWIKKYAMSKADLITCDAEHIIKPLAGLGVDPQKVKTIYFGTDVNKYTPKRRDEKLKQELGISGLPTVVSLRRLEAVCDVESFVRAVPIVLKEAPEARFWIVDTGSQEEMLKQLTKSLGVSENVQFLGRLPQDELPRYLASADVYVSASLSDAGLSASTAEAMASGLPVIITDFGDNRRWVEDGVNGYIIPLKSPEALASKVITLLKNEEVRKKFGSKNREIIMERNNWEREMEKMAGLYRELIKRNTSTESS